MHYITVLSSVVLVACFAQTMAQPGSWGIRGNGRFGTDRFNRGFPAWDRWGIGQPATDLPPWVTPFPLTVPPFLFNTPAPEIPVETPGSMPGGMTTVQEITQSHRDLADFAAMEIGSEYSVTSLTKVRQQVVAGMNYEMEIIVTKVKGTDEKTFECTVKIYEVVWMNQKSLEEFMCKKVPVVTEGPVPDLGSNPGMDFVPGK